MKIYSQRDKKWSGIKLGTSSSTTIGSHGCTITCVGMLANLPPDEVNKRLLSVNGYAETNLIVWDKIHAAIPYLTFEFRSYVYDNAKVSDAIKKYGGCLVEVDGAPIGGSKHWVLYVGNQKLYDPWDGKEKPTSSYKTLGYSTIQTLTPPSTPEPPDTCQKELEQCRIQRDAHRNEHIAVCSALGLPEDSSTDTIVKSINAYKGNAAKYEECEKQLESIKTAHSEQVGTLSQQLIDKQKTIETLTIGDTTVVQPYIDQLNSKDKQITAMAEQIKQLQLQKPKQSLWELFLKLFTKRA